MCAATTTVPAVSPAENDEGNVEYKQQLANLSDDRITHLITQMRYRLDEGGGECFYELGLADDGTPVGLPDDKLKESVDNVKQMAVSLHSEATVMNTRQGLQGKIVEILVRHFPLIGGARSSDGFTQGVIPEVRVACVGNVDAGKSTLLGVLIRGELDTGRGLARTSIFVHKHEIETGRTSYIASAILGYDSHGQVVNYDAANPGHDDHFISSEMSEVVKKSSKIVSFYDLAGHEKYLRTTISGLTGRSVDYTMLVVGGNNGVTHMTKEHYYLSIAMHLPCYIVVTKSDMCPKNVLRDCFTGIKSMLKSGPAHRTPLMISGEEQAIMAARSLGTPCNKLVPVFLISSVTGDGLALLRSFLNLLPCPNWTSRMNERAELHVDETFNPPGVGCVVSGCLVSGCVEVNQTLLLGPDQCGHFNPVQVKSIEYKRVPVRCVYAGQSCTLALKKIKRNALRRGMVLLGEQPSCPEVVPEGAAEFVAEVIILHHSTTIHKGYQSVIHANSIAQSTSVLDIKILSSEDQDVADGTKEPILRSGDKGLVRFRFMHRPEYLTKNQLFVFREGTTRGVGRVVSTTPVSECVWLTYAAVANKKPRVG